MRDKFFVEGTLQVKFQINQGEKKKNFKGRETVANTNRSNKQRSKEFPPFILLSNVGEDLMLSVKNATR